MKSVPLFLILLLGPFSGTALGGTAPPSRGLLTTLSCLHNKLAARRGQLALNQLSSGVERLAPKSRILSGETIKTWLDKESQAPEVDAWVQAQLQLSPEQRIQALAALHQTITDPSILPLARLALYDEDLWKQSYWQVALLVAQDSHGAHRTLQRMIENMPESLKRKLLAGVTEKYAKEQKMFQAPHQSFWMKTHLGPKRGMDAFLKIVLKPEKNLIQAIQSGRSPAEAYSDFLKNQKNMLFPLSETGNYDFAEVLFVCRNIQKEMKKNPTLDGSREAAIIGGSFVNGRANLKTSDIDIIDPTSDLMNAIKKVEPRASDVPINAVAQGRLNPFQIRVQTGGIDLIVYTAEKDPQTFHLE